MKIIAKFETALQRKALDKIEACVNKLGSLRLPKEIIIDFSLNSVTTGGQCSWIGDELKVIELHGKALEFYGDVYIDRTVVHEFAHIIQYYNFPGSSPHSESWHYVMRLLGAEDVERCHSYNLYAVTGKKKVRQRRWEYTCDCIKPHSVATVTHNRMQNKGQVRTCKACNFQIRWTGKEIK